MLGSAVVHQPNPERDIESSSPLQKYEPPQESSAQHFAKVDRSQFPMLFRAGFRRWALPNQTNHLAGLRFAGLRNPGSHHLYGALIKTKPPCLHLRMPSSISPPSYCRMIATVAQRPRMPRTAPRACRSSTRRPSSPATSAHEVTITSGAIITATASWLLFSGDIT